MITFRPFKALRPNKELAEQVVAPPYDVIDIPMSREIGKNPNSLVHITRSEIHFGDDVNPYSQEVYDNAKATMAEFEAKGILFEEDAPAYYIYRQIMNGRAQNGIVGCGLIDDYSEGRVKRHEFTRVDKEIDRINHFYTCNANTEPVFLFYQNQEGIKNFIADFTLNNTPEYDMVTEDGVSQILWAVKKEDEVAALRELFTNVDSLYIADGHHRTASAYKVGSRKREENPGYTGEEEFNFFMSVVFPADELFIMPYNRLVKDTNGLSKEEFMAKVEEKFKVTEFEGQTAQEIEPSTKKEITMIMDSKQYSLVPRLGSFDESDVIASLDTSILQNNLLNPILGIEDPRTNKRIEFFGGETMLADINNKLQGYKEGVAFLLYPTDINDIIKVSDAGEVMPPKSTWFEPKLKSGLFIHKL